MLKRHVASTLLLGILCLLALGSVPGDDGPGPPPTEAEVRQTIEKGFTDVYLKDDFNARADQIFFEFGPIQVGEVVQKQMGLGEAPRPVYPVRVSRVS